MDMELEYTYYKAEDGFFVGWFDDFPEDVTQGETLEELEEMLMDMYECLNLVKYHKGKLILA
ncbi:MAG: type II toxin-antitoxin system HicB family antitoxin [Spirochaetaceae bacterium]|jgi:predicted RNase H-like HicB family nuclease|nr:type II toxin-antitoxin system HicB family antitoxin [Spirochaetaceae bacterium]